MPISHCHWRCVSAVLMSMSMKSMSKLSYKVTFTSQLFIFLRTQNLNNMWKVCPTVVEGFQVRKGKLRKQKLGRSHVPFLLVIFFPSEKVLKCLVIWKEIKPAFFCLCHPEQLNAQEMGNTSCNWSFQISVTENYLERSTCSNGRTTKRQTSHF